jgi:flagellar motor switch protein FliM
MFGLPIDKNPTILCEDNVACLTHMKEGYIISDGIKNIPPKFFSFTQELKRNKDVDIQYIRSSDNVADLFTKTFPTSVFKKLKRSIEICHLRDL